jgi:dTDP-4-amino-4,6-dideoxygalactose transaminase
LAARLRALRQYGWSQKYTVALQGGRNSRLDELQAALLLVRLTELDQTNARRQHIATRYSTEITHPQIQLPAPPTPADVAHLYVLRCAAREGLRDWLRHNGIGCDVHYPIADHQQVAYADIQEKLPHAERACAEVLSLPCFAELSETEIASVITTVNRWPGMP